jgi:tripartite-type tricarboxylate transporter receptor subunit TctC
MEQLMQVQGKNIPSCGGSAVMNQCGFVARTIAGAVLAAAASGAWAQAAAVDSYPSKPVRFLSPFSAGGGTDTVARALAQLLGESLGRTFVVDNRAGAEGTIGTELGARAQPDGYTLLLANLGTLTIAPNLRKVNYDPMKDFSYITLTTESSSILVVHPSVPARSVGEFVKLAKAKPGGFNYAASSAATMLPMELFKQMAGIELTHVPYKGTGPSITAMLGGETQVMFGGAINTVIHVRNGRLRALAVAGGRRASALPNVPTVAESGYPGYNADSWNGVVAPAGMPKPLVARLNGAIQRVVLSPRFKEVMAGDGADPVVSTPEAFFERVRTDHAKWKQVIDRVGLRG